MKHIRLIIENRVQRKHYHSKQRLLASLVEQSLVPIMIANADANVIYANPVFYKTTRYNDHDIIGKNLKQLHTLTQVTPCYQSLCEALDNQTHWVGNFLNSRKKEGAYGEETHIFPLVDTQNCIKYYACILVDITERKQTENKLRITANVFDHAQEGIIITDCNATIIETNQAICELTGYRSSELIGQKPSIFKSDLHDRHFYASLRQALISKGGWSGEIWNRKKSGDLFASLTTISSVPDEQKKTQYYVAMYSDITDRKEYERKLEYIAHYDALTQLPNRVLLADRLNHIMIQTLRRKTLLAVVYLDLDGFKMVNDSYGHDAGDYLLTTLAKRMKYALRKGDTIARIGGDEFVALLADLPSIDKTVFSLNRLLKAAAKPVQYGDATFRVSASLGVTFYPQNNDIEADQLLRQADQAMYQAKLAGKNNYHIFDADQELAIYQQQRILEQLQRALEYDKVILHYQPIFNLRTQRVVALQALIYWQHPERGLCPVTDVLDHCNNLSLNMSLDSWLIKQIIEQLATHPDQATPLPIKLAINCSALQFPTLIQQLHDLLHEYASVNPTLLELDISTLQSAHDSTLQALLDDCQKSGITLAVNGFDTDHSNLLSLTLLSAKTVKISYAFIKTTLQHSNGLLILQSILNLIKATHGKILVTGIDHEMASETLLKIGYDIGQGCYLASPMPAHKLASWIKNTTQ